MGWEGLDGRPLLLNGVARRPFVRLSTTMKSPKPGEAGDHQCPPILPSSTLAPTDVDERGLRLMPLGRPLWSPWQGAAGPLQASRRISVPGRGDPCGRPGGVRRGLLAGCVGPPEM